MKRAHFERLKPICPRCRRTSGSETPLTIGSVLQEERAVITQGILLCSDRQCQKEYPIIDGIPIIVDDLRTYISQNILPILWRPDLEPEMESLIGDCCGPASALNAHRQNLSSYTFDHYGDLDPGESGTAPSSPGCIRHVTRESIEFAAPTAPGPILDIGCAVGRTTFELAARFDELVLGVDLGFDMLRVAARVLQKGVVSYPRRRVGMVYDRREFPAAMENPGKVDFWACDATALPFPASIFSLATSFNVIDCLNSPFDHLHSLDRILAAGGHAILSTPYDWSTAATPIEAWMGGHSQRSAKNGDSETILKSLLAGGDHPMALKGLRLVKEVPDLPWSVRLHDRSTMQYKSHLVVIESVADTS